ncbi:gag-protease polyprotein [Cucumis melo var. makuwa]|uniref:Gag-protease polyprotein n=1 Tax=Cucumis melo var. makuwa TaxID=1194695 RepID=A0A5D3CDJ2_CUCMM|nr:gag-protease polyprotein [Cucumis melo var. makuwa]TYK09901.1 gag-protease polyprotein [Cucumis melo var. makuwa]
MQHHHRPSFCRTMLPSTNLSIVVVIASPIVAMEQRYQDMLREASYHFYGYHLSFKENFYAKFFSASLKDAKQQEFLELQQSDMIVEQYDAEFNMLSRFAPKMASYPANALRLAVDMSLPDREKVNLRKEKEG